MKNIKLGRKIWAILAIPTLGIASMTVPTTITGDTPTANAIMIHPKPRAAEAAPGEGQGEGEDPAPGEGEGEGEDPAP
ncbi:hypothetical protein, partial [Corynebacterium spheniscorum]